jgi:hypothetical protein
VGAKPRFTADDWMRLLAYSTIVVFCVAAIVLTVYFAVFHWSQFVDPQDMPELLPFFLLLGAGAVGLLLFFLEIETHAGESVGVTAPAHGAGPLPHRLAQSKRTAIAICFVAMACVMSGPLVFAKVLPTHRQRAETTRVNERKAAEKAAEERLLEERTKLDAAIELAREKNAKALPQLTAFLDSKSWENRRDAAEALGQLGDKRATPALCVLLEDGDLRVMETAATALAKLGDETALDPLLRALKNRPRTERWAVASAFLTIRDERAIPYLVQGLESDADIHAASQVEDAILNQGPAAIPLLIDSALEGGPGAWTLAEVEKTTHKEISPFHEAMTRGDLEMLAQIYPFFLNLDQDYDRTDDLDERLTTAEQRTLAAALTAHGDKEMAEDFANFRINGGPWESTILPDAAYEWADRHGYELVRKRR